jgi:hypothetical protein
MRVNGAFISVRLGRDSGLCWTRPLLIEVFFIRHRNSTESVPNSHVLVRRADPGVEGNRYYRQDRSTIRRRDL